MIFSTAAVPKLIMSKPWWEQDHQWMKSWMDDLTPCALKKLMGNFRGASKWMMEESSKGSEIEEQLEQSLDVLLLNATSENNFTFPENFTRNFLRFQRLRAFGVLKTQFMYQLSQLNDSQRVMLGHQLNDTVLDCTFDGQECSLDR